MIEFSTKIEWLDDFFKKVWQLAFTKTLNKSIKKAITTVERDSKINTPVDTGILRNSYQTDFTDLKWELRNYRDYWLYVHEWTRYQKANPFFRRAIESNEQWIQRIFENDLIDLLEFLTNE